MKRIPSLDGLRAVSITLVVLGHWCFQNYRIDAAGSYARLGVRIFFVISGYLITTLLTNEELETGDISLRCFYVRRAYRILPASIVFMLVAFLMYWRQLRWYDIAAAVLYLTNFVPTPSWPLAHLWSLSVEEQFYLLWPGAMKLFRRHRTGGLVFVVGFAPLYTAAGYWLKLPSVWHTFPAVADNLAIGCLLAILWDRIPTPQPMHLVAAVVVTASVPLLAFDTKWNTLLGLLLLYPLLYLAIACVVIRVVRMPPRFLNIAAVAWLGKISYSVYLWQELFTCTPKAHPWWWMIVAILVGAVSYYLVERPALRLRELRRPPRSHLEPLPTIDKVIRELPGKRARRMPDEISTWGAKPQREIETQALEQTRA